MHIDIKKCIHTLKNNLHTYDNNIWSLYEKSGLALDMFASAFYHDLHIVQLKNIKRDSTRKVILNNC